MGIRLGVALTLPLLVLGACGDSSDGTGRSPGMTVPDLDGTSWIATRITEAGKPRPLVAGSQLRVEFADGRISINAGCNAMGGSYRLSADSELSTGNLMSTEMACDPPLMDQDTWIAGTVLGSPLLASVDGDTLTLSREGLEVVLADRARVSPDALLVGTAWQLDGIRSGDVVASLPAGAEVPTLAVAEDGSVTLSTGCNRGRSTATVSGSTVTFTPVLTTRKACADASGRQTEAAVLAVLEGEVTWSITEKTLTLTKGEQGLIYRAAS